MQARLSSKFEVMEIADQRVRKAVDQGKCVAVDPESAKAKFSPDAQITHSFCSTLFNLLQVS